MRCAVASGGTPAARRRQGSRSRAIHNRVNHLRGRSTLFPLPAVGGQTSHFAGIERRMSQAERSPGSPWGGDGVAGAPPLTRLVTQHAGNLEPGFSKRMPRSAQAHGKLPTFSAESIVLLVGGAASAQLTGGYGSSPALPPAPPLPGLGEDPAPEDLSPRTEPARALSPSARDRLYAQSLRTV